MLIHSFYVRNASYSKIANTRRIFDDVINYETWTALLHEIFFNGQSWIQYIGVSNKHHYFSTKIDYSSRLYIYIFNCVKDTFLLGNTISRNVILSQLQPNKTVYNMLCRQRRIRHWNDITNNWCGWHTMSV